MDDRCTGSAIADVIRRQTMSRRFTIRTLLVVTFLVAVFLALPFRKARMQMQGREWVASQRGHITFRHELDRSTNRYSIPFVPNWMVVLCGVDMFNPVVGVALYCETVEEFESISNLTSLESLGIIIDMADNIDFSPLQTLPRLKEIHFTEWSGITREQLNEVRELLPNVEIYSESYPDG
jgi:hypothetical protein